MSALFMPPPRGLGRPGLRPLALASIAGAAIAFGVAVYAFARPQPALFLPATWHRPLAHGLPTALLGVLPTFVHALAMPLLTAALLQPRRKAGLRAICAAWCVVEIAFELAQHPRIGHALLNALPVDARSSALLAPFGHFVRSGRFDALDVATALLASMVACAILLHTCAQRADSKEAGHV
jgi:hypothetical protein